MAFAAVRHSGTDAVIPPPLACCVQLWNDQTKLLSYITVWYLGNVYCK